MIMTMKTTTILAMFMIDSTESFLDDDADDFNDDVLIAVMHFLMMMVIMTTTMSDDGGDDNVSSGMIAAMDSAIGSITDLMETRGYLDNMLMIFTTDVSCPLFSVTRISIGTKCLAFLRRRKNCMV